MKRKRVGGEEQDAFSRRSRNLYRWHPGQLRSLKRRAAKRERRGAAAEVTRLAEELGLDDIPESEVVQECREARREMSAELAAELRQALDATERGETDDLGSFAQYAEDED